MSGTALGHALAVLRGPRRAEGTVRRQQVVLDRFAAFLAGRGLDAASDQVCIDFIENQTGVRFGSLRESVKDRGVQAVRPPMVLMADFLAGRAVDARRSVIPARTTVLRYARSGPITSLVPSARQCRGDRGRERRTVSRFSATWTRWASMIS